MHTPKDRSFVAAPADDARLIALLRSGDAHAFEHVYRSYVVALCQLADSYVRSRDAAEDIVQDLFTWLWANRHGFHPEHGLRAYLFGAVRNRALNALRDEATASRVVETHLTSGNGRSESADAELMAADLESAIQAAVEGMPPRCREVFVLLRTQTLTYAEVAVILGISPKTVEVHMTRALAILRARLGPWLSE
ncbi:MAG: RNA polymerase sigma-70 factor [Gemmatimonadaceae bacterium]